MFFRTRLLAALLFGLFLSGCGSDQPIEPGRAENKASAYVPFDLAAPIDVSLEDLLKKPRRELAELSEEWAKKVDFQMQMYQKGEARFDFLPSVRLPLSIPVWRQARYDGLLDCSVPTYFTGKKDSDLALHLARHGDVEAALKLLQPGDTRTRSQIDALQLTRNYSVEWTRLVALMLHEAEFRLLSNDLHGGRTIVMVHKQLLSLLDGKARSSALGVALLSRGKGLLKQAEEEWRKTKEAALADQASVALASWSAGGWFEPVLRPGISRGDVERLLQGHANGQVLIAPSPLRALDLLSLAVPDQGVEGVVCCFDPDGKLREILIGYQSRLPERIPYPTQLAAHLEENDALHASELVETGHVRRRLYRRGSTQIHVEIVPENPVVGALVRLPLADRPPASAPLVRAFGDVSLDRSFEQNRTRVALKQRKGTVEASQSNILQHIDQPLKQPEVKLDQASLERTPQFDLLQSITLRYSFAKSQLPFHRLVEPLWARAGSAELQDVRDGQGGHLSLTWDDARTRTTFRLPHRRERPIELAVTDLTSANELEKRQERIRETDLAERRERFAQKQPLVRLPRGLENVKLGMTEPDFLSVLPKDKYALRRKIDGGWSVSLLKPSKKPYVARELTVRFDPAGRLAELRVSYVSAPETKGVDVLLSEWKGTGGAAEVIRPDLAKTAWADLPAMGSTVVYRWQDDVTLATCQVDSSGAVATLRDCPLESPQGRPLPALSSLPRGVEGIELGMTKEVVLKKWGGQHSKETDGFLVLTPRNRDEFDVLLVKFDKDRAVRLLARHVLDSKAQAGQMAALLKKAWERNFRLLGWPMREYQTLELSLPGWVTLDERTRCRIYWEQDAGENLRLLTEWIELHGSQK
jgi:hypothetical protein